MMREKVYLYGCVLDRAMIVIWVVVVVGGTQECMVFSPLGQKTKIVRNIYRIISTIPDDATFHEDKTLFIDHLSVTPSRFAYSPCYFFLSVPLSPFLSFLL